MRTRAFIFIALIALPGCKGGFAPLKNAAAGQVATGATSTDSSDSFQLPPAPSPGGSVSTPQPASVFTVDVYSPASGQTVAPSMWITISGVAKSTGGWITGVRYAVNGVAVCTATMSPYNCSYLTPSGAGTYTLTADATDSTGASFRKQTSFQVGGTSVVQPPPAATPVPTPAPTPTPAPPSTNGRTVTPQIPGYAVYFADEFDNLYNGAPNPAAWDYDVDANINGELQCYTENRRENVRVENRTIDGASNGVLVLQTRKENYACPYAGGRVFQYTSGGIQTRKKGWGQILLDMPFGRYEIRAKIPKGKGTWPAVWLLGESNLGGWPNSGEIDIMEQVGYEEENGVYKFYSTLHRDGNDRPWPTQLGNFTGMGHQLSISEPPSLRFHTFTLDWTPTSLEFFVDGIRVTKRTILWDSIFEDHDGFFRDQIANSYDDLGWPFGRPAAQNAQFYMILNLAFGGGWGGAAGVDPTIFDQRSIEMLVDYVRIYKKL